LGIRNYGVLLSGDHEFRREISGIRRLVVLPGKGWIYFCSIIYKIETMEPTDEKRVGNPNKKFAFGFVVILAGLLLLAFNFDMLPWNLHRLFFSWQMLLIAIGVISIASSESRTPGIILILVGSFFLIPEIFDFHIAFIKLFWPVLLIAIGVMILLKRGFRKPGHYHRRRYHQWSNPVPDSELDEGYINETNIFSGSKRKITHQVFKGGKISNIFGGAEIDLSQAVLAEGRVELTIECIFGGVTLIVPSDWKVVINVSSVMGGFSDKRNILKEPTDPSRTLVIRGESIFGGGEIKSY
jgi:predicted membrane protein